MIFPSLFVGSDVGILSQTVAFVVLVFSYLLYSWKNLAVFFSITFLLLFSARTVFSVGMIPGACGTLCMAQMRTYGAPMGGTPLYPYPSVYPSYMNNTSWMMPPSPYRPSWMNDCIECNMLRPPSYYDGSSGWWPSYGYRNYNNFSYPGAWNSGGIDGGAYPGHGPFVAGKPNVYFSGRPGQEINFKITFAEDANLLAAIPAAVESGHQLRFLENQRLKVEGVEYPYMFYDYRLGMEALQSIKGFCVERNELMPRLESILYRLDFRQNEVNDFKEYWSVKMPPSKEYCVYPQVDRELKKIAEFAITPVPSKITRLLFIILTKESSGNQQLGKFAQRPTESWNYPISERQIASIDGQEGFEVREWGVGFFAVN